MSASSERTVLLLVHHSQQEASSAAFVSQKEAEIELRENFKYGESRYVGNKSHVRPRSGNDKQAHREPRRLAVQRGHG
jgi:hypothetical protein